MLFPTTSVCYTFVACIAFPWGTPIPAPGSGVGTRLRLGRAPGLGTITRAPGRGGHAAVAAVPVDPETVVHDLEAGTLRDGFLYIVEKVLVELEDAATAQAYEVMVIMLLELRVELVTTSFLSELQLVDDAQALEDVESPVHGGVCAR